MVEEFSSLSTKEKIIKVTMEIIAAEGFQNVTVRKITSRAGVNLAAVNYYFGSKDAVINEALITVTLQLKNAFLHLKEEKMDPPSRLALFLKDYAEVLFKYPDIIKIIIDQNIHNYPTRVEAGYQEYLKDEGLNLIIGTLGQINPDESIIILKMRALHLLSCLAFPILMGDRIIEMIEIDLNDIENRKIYSDLLLNYLSLASSSHN